MKKTIAIVAGVVVVVAGGWVGATWYTGKRIEDVNAEQVAKANALLAAQYPRLAAQLTPVSYERGVFVSQARYALTSALADEVLAPAVHGPKPPEQVVWLDVRIEHGPFPASAVREGHLAPKMAHTHAEVARTDTLSRVFELTGGQSPLQTNALLGYNGDALIDWTVPAVNYAGQGRTLAFSGAQGSGKYFRGTQSGEGSMRVESLKLQGGDDEQGAHFELTGLEASGDSRPGKFGVGVGQGHMTAKQIVAGSREAGMAVTLSKPAYRLSIAETDSKIGGEAAYSAENIQIGKVSLGAGELVLKASNLDGDAVKAISAQYQNMSAALMQGTSEESMERSLNDLSAVMGYGQQIMAGHPVISMDPFSLKSDQGEQRGSFTIEFNAVPLGLSNAQETAIKSVKRIDASLSLSKPMAVDLAAQFLVDLEDMAPVDARRMAQEQIDQGLMMAQMFNIGKVQDDKLVSTFRYADGVVSLNGTDTPVDAFLSQFGLTEDEDDVDTIEEALDEEALAEVEIESAQDGVSPMIAPSAGGRNAGEDDVSDADSADVVILESDGLADDARAAADVAGVDVTSVAGAEGADILNAVTTGTITPILDDLGYSYQVGVDASDDPHLKIDPRDTGASEIEIVYFSCSDHRVIGACEDMLLRARFAPSKQATLSKINAFNQENRWARAFLDEGKVPVIEMDLNADGGVGRASLTTLIGIYFSLVKDFADEIGAR